jgi:hypothetical protein
MVEIGSCRRLLEAAITFRKSSVVSLDPLFRETAQGAFLTVQPAVLRDGAPN